MTQPPSIEAPVCYRHPNRETYVRCSRCDRPICPDCMTEAAVGHQCPECVAEGRRSTRPARTAFGGSAAGGQGYVTLTLITLNVIMAVIALISARNASALAGGGLGGLLGNVTPLHMWGALIAQPTSFTDHTGTVIATVQGVAGGEYYRLFTSMFLHYGLLHLLMNMWALWILGRVLEAMLGPARFLALYLLSGLGGNVAVYLFSNQHAPTAGASGAIFGLFGALIIVLRRLRRSVASVLPVLVINLIFTLSVPGISIAAHFGGLVTGALVAAGLAYAPRSVRTPVQLAVVAATSLLLAGLTAWWTVAVT
jgi:membrane associated rhomboid family serine protease